MAKEPNSKDANIGKLLLLDNKNKFVDALALTQRYLQHRDDLQMRLLNLHFLLLNSKFKEAQSEYDALPKVVLERPLVKGFLAQLQLNDKKPELAIENGLVAYNSSSSLRNLIVLVSAYTQLGQTANSIALLEEHLEKQPNDQAARMLLAEKNIGTDVTSAIAQYEQAVAQNPNNYIAFNNLAYLHLKAGQLKKAKEYGEQAVSLQPDNSAALDTLARVLFTDREFDKALELYERAITDAMKNEEIYLNYVETLLAAEKTFLATRKLKQREMKEPVSIQRVAELKAKYQLK
ncbi:tetratricopeptide repeat protein [Paraglaciecola aquimarina]|uniref:Tetratricopeptide repeat protein n=1 Tax=Paraglaciecola aquimarina TaxID=1235557 RepID=A0ABU3SU81_9ALTE|nr:tetratricopeptide repeat protein [Paraglaciecola aquimarina]MDU0353565.1 tetratricopeptide repeat protein [Paraglaciecola aquimarina]